MLIGGAPRAFCLKAVKPHESAAVALAENAHKMRKAKTGSLKLCILGEDHWKADAVDSHQPLATRILNVNAVYLINHAGN